MVDNCTNCDTIITGDGGDGLCDYCRSKQTHCEHFTHLTEGYRIPVPWCELKGKRVLIHKGWLCDECEERG